MKLKLERFDCVSCFSIRGPIATTDLKLLLIGIETLLKDLEETLLVNVSLATYGKTELVVLNEIKKKTKTATEHDVFWVTRDKALSDFPTVEIMVSRLPTKAARQIGERIRLDDLVYTLKEETTALEAKISELGGNEQNIHKIILENQMLKAQKKILSDSVQWQSFRLKHQEVQPSDDEEILVKIEAAREELNKLLGKDSGL